MKTNSKIITGIILGLIVLLVSGVFIFMNTMMDLFQSTPAPAALVSVTQTVSPKPPSTSAVQTSAQTSAPATVSNSPAPSTSATPSSTPPVTTAPPASPEPPPSVEIELAIISVEGSGFSRIVNGELINQSAIDLHNAKLKVEIFANNKLIRNDGQTHIEKSLGTIKAGAVIRDAIPIKLGLIDGLNIEMNGCVVVLTFTSDQKNQTFSYDYKP